MPIQVFLPRDSSFAVHDTIFHVIDTSAIFTGDTTATGIHVREEDTGIWVYPVPAGSFLVINTVRGIGGKLIIRDVHGRLHLESVVSDNPLLLNVEFLDPGIYIIGIISEDKKEFRRFLKK